MEPDVEVLYKDYLARICEKATKEQVVKTLQDMFSVAINNKRTAEKNFEAYKFWKENSEKWQNNSKGWEKLFYEVKELVYGG